MQPLGLCLLPACVMALSRRYALTCSENSRASKVSNVRSLICRKAVWGEGLTAADMEKCLWLKPKLVAAIEYAPPSAGVFARDHADVTGQCFPIAEP